MANVKISDLTAYTDAASTDILPIVDIGNDVTKKITIGDVVKAVPLGTAALPGLAFDGDPNSGVYSPGADQVAISTNGTGRLLVDASGNVGVGAAPSQRLSVFSGTSAGINNVMILKGGGSSAGNGAGLILSPDSANTYANWYGARLATAFGGASWGCDLIFSTNNNTADSNLTEAMRLTSAGHLGLGTSSPSDRLSVVAPADTAAYINVQAGGSATVLREAGVYLNASKVTGGFGTSSIKATGDPDGSNGSTLVLSTEDSSNSLTERVRIDSSGRVGIGTTGPERPLDVYGPANGYAAHIGGQIYGLTRGLTIGTFESGGAADCGVEFNAALNNTGFGSFTFKAGSNERARIDSSGRLLVGTSTTLPVYYNAAATWNANFQVARSDQNAVANFSIWNSTASTYTSYGGVQLHLSACKSGTVGSHTSGALASGDTIGTITFNSSDGTNFRNSARIEAVVDGGVSTGDVPGRLVFSTTADGASSPTERMRIFSGGGFSVYSSTTGNDTIDSCNNQGAGTTYSTFIGRHSASGTTSGTVSVRIYTNGNIVNTNNSYGSISDIKLKENIVDANSQWDDLKALQVRNYNFKEGQTHTQIGLVAQEVELVSPGLVSESPDRDEEGNDLGTVTKSVNYSVLYMKAVKALQEAMERIEQLETEMVEVKAQLQAS